MRRTFCANTSFTLFVLAIAVLAANCSGGGSDGGGTPYVPPVPTMGLPSSIIAVAGNNSVMLLWSPVEGASSYNIYRSASSPVTKTTGTKIGSGIIGTVYSDLTVTNGSKYVYVMTSIRSGVESVESSEVSVTPGSSGVISGRVTYEDKEIGSTGFTGRTMMKAVRHADIDVVRVSDSFVLYSTQTDSLGIYSVATATGTTSVYVRVNSTALPPTAPTAVTVANLSGGKYGVPSQNFTLAGDAAVNISVSTTNTAGGAFNILDVMTSGYDYIKSLSGSYPVVPLFAYWTPGNLNGTYFCYGGCPAGDGIYVFSQTGVDTDEYDDDVLWHEFGHFAAYHYSLDDSPGGVHYLSDNNLDLRLSWSEGWGDFFPGAVKAWLKSSGQDNLLSSAAGVSSTMYVDTSGSSGWSFDFGNPTMNGSYATSEVAVAKLLYDLQTNYSIQKIWDVITNFRSLPPADPVNLELFWDRWKNIYSTAPASYFASRLINYSDDSYEADNASASAKTIIVGQPQERTLYSDVAWPSVDIDLVSFNTTTGRQYTITTSNLRNGADTYLTLLNTDGATEIATSTTTQDNTNGMIWKDGADIWGNCLIGSNYDCYLNNIWQNAPLNNTTNLASKIVWKAPSSGTYYLEVTPSPKRPKSAGKYGSYTLTVASP